MSQPPDMKPAVSWGKVVIGLWPHLLGFTIQFWGDSMKPRRSGSLFWHYVAGCDWFSAAQVNISSLSQLNPEIKVWTFFSLLNVIQQSTSVRDDQVFETTYRTSKHTHSFSKMRSQVGFTALRSWSCVLINGYCRSCFESSSGSCSFFKRFSIFPIHEMFVVAR